MSEKASFREVFAIFLRLGLTSFGGPAAHLGYFHDEFVRRRGWLSEGAYGEVVALCQLLPGPASSQTGLAIGFLRGHYRGALAAWLAFTLPSAILMALFAFGLSLWPDAAEGGWVSGLKLFVVTVVGHAVWQMGRNLCPDALRQGLALMVAVILLLAGSALVQVAALTLAGFVGFMRRVPPGKAGEALSLPVQGRRPMVFVVAFVLLLLASFLPAEAGSMRWLAAEMYRSGALVFGGGHVVLPWLQEGFVGSGQVPADTFLAGYGAAQAVPGPLFTFSAFLGGISGGVPGAVLALLAVFLPGVLLVFAGLPLWQWLRRHERARSALAGVNAGVVGLLLAALYDPVWTSAVNSPAGLAFVLGTWWALSVARMPVWVLAPACAALGELLF